MKRLAFALFGLAALTQSCDNDIDVNAPFKETTVVYGAIDADDPVHYIRITRAYLGEQGIYGGNDVSDSLYYDSLQVELIELNENGNITNTFPAVKDNSVQLDSGFFETDGYHVYRVNATLDEANSYRVKITRGDDKTITATTDMVKEFSVLYPRFATVNPTAINGMRVEWEQAEDGRIYQAHLHMYYVEFPRDNKADSTRGRVTYDFPTFTGSSLAGTGNILTSINTDQFYGNLANKLDAPTGNRIRIHRRVDLVVDCGADDLATHINVSQPQTGVLQDPPFFTNVDGGVGIFSSMRSSYALNKRLHQQAIDELVYGDYTCHLRFGKVTTSDTLFCQ